jgi:3-methyladenine DNA glycosylase AlkD
MAFIELLEVEFQRHANYQRSIGQKAYMRNQFDFFGLDAATRRKVQQHFLLSKFLPSKSEAHQLIIKLWKKPQRDFQYVAQELAFKYVNVLEKDDIQLFEYMVVHKSWWDTIDYIAPKLIGNYFNKYPEQRETYIQKWIASENSWLQRSAILFQLKYKSNLDTELLEKIINSLNETNEFFINKAIGWILREYSRTNPNWVIAFVKKTPLSNLSKKEALRLIN